MAKLVPHFITTFLNLQGNTANTANQVFEDSWADLAAPSRIDPLCIITKDLLTTEYYDTLLQVSTSLAASYYIRALPFAYGEEGKAVTKVLNKLKPGRGYDIIGATESHVTESDYKFGLPTPAVEARSKASAKKGKASEKKGGKEKKGLHGKVADGFEAPAGLAVGKVLEISIPVPNKDTPVDVQVTVQLITMPVSPMMATALMSSENIDATWKERYHKWKSNRISFLDLISGVDLVEKRKKLMLEDTHGILAEVSSRRKAGLFNAAMVTDDRSYGVSTNILIVSTRSAEAAEMSHRGKLDDSSGNARRRIMNELSLLVLMVIDKEEEIVDIYFRDSDKKTEITVRSLKKVDKKDGPDITEVMAALSTNKSVVF